MLWLSVALASLAECEQQWMRDRDDPAVWRCVYGEAMAGDIEPAVAFAERALDAHPTPQTHLTYGNLLGLQRDPGAASAYRDAAQAFADAGEVPGRVKSLLNLAVEHRHRGRLDESWEALAVASDAAGELEPFSSMVTIERARWVCQVGGDYAAARDDLESLDARLDEPGFPMHGKILVMHTRRCLADRLGRAAEAHGYESDLLELAVASGNAVLEVVTLDNLLWREHDAGGSPDLLERARDALERAQQVEHAPTTADLTCLVDLLEPTSDFQPCLDAVDGMEDAIAVRAHTLAAERLRGEQARAHANRAVSLARASGDLEALVGALAVSARLADGASAVEIGAEAVEAVIALRERQSDRIVRSRFVGEWAGVLLEQAARWVARDEPEKAVRVVERLRGYRALERLDRADATGFLVPDDTRWTERDALLTRIAALTEEGRDPDALEVLQRREAELRQELLAAVPAFGMLRSADVDLDGIRAALAPGEVILLPVLGATPWVASIRREGLTVTPLPGSSAWASRIESLSGLEASDPIAERARLQLSEALLGPLALDGVEHIVVVAGPDLNALDWGALPYAGRRLDADRTLSYAPSLRTFSALRSRPENTSGTTVVVADPTTSAERLPAARGEADTVASLAPGRVVRLQGDGAHEDALREATRQAVRLIHIAAHAVVDSGAPERSAILLAQGAGTDGRLQVREVLGYGLDGAVVVLSACEGAAGEEGVDGVHGLAEAFLQAGAKAVVASRRPLRDDVARQLFEAVHVGLAHGARLDRAVGDALQERGVAGVRVIGDGSVVLPGTRGSDRGWMALVVLGGLAVIGGLAVRRWR